MRRSIYLSDEARETMLTGFREGWSWDAIRAALLEKGAAVSVRSLQRRRSDWRAEGRLLEMARELGVAIAACDVGRIFAGDLGRLSAEQLAARIILVPDWRATREKILHAAIRSFLANPTPARAFAAQQEIMMLLYESQLANWHKVTKKLVSRELQTHAG